MAFHYGQDYQWQFQRTRQICQLLLILIHIHLHSKLQRYVLEFKRRILNILENSNVGFSDKKIFKFDKKREITLNFYL